MLTGKPLSFPGKTSPPTPGRGSGSRKSLSRGSPSRGPRGPLGPPPTPGKPARKPIVHKAPVNKRIGEPLGQGFITNFFTAQPSASLEASPPEDSPELSRDASVCSDGFRLFTAAHPPRLSQCNDSSSQGCGFGVLSSLSQDWLAGGSGLDSHKPSVSPPHTAQKKRRSALFDEDNAVDSLSHNIHAVQFNSPGVLTRNQSKLAGVQPGTMALEGASVNKFWLGVESVTHDRELNEMNAKRKRQREIVPADVTSRFLLEFAKVAEIGKGSFCTVSQVKHRLDGCTYAVKKYIRELCTEQQRLRALSEVHALSALVDCRTVLRYYSSWFEGSVLYVQTEMCWGSLEQLVCGTQASHTTLSQSAHRDISNRISGGSGGTAEIPAPEDVSSDSEDENAPSLLRCNAATPSHVPPSHPGSFSAQKAVIGTQTRRSARSLLSPQSPGRFDVGDDSDAAEPSSPVAHHGPLRRPLLKPPSHAPDDDIVLATPQSQVSVESPCLTTASPESCGGKFSSQRGLLTAAVLPSSSRQWLNESLLKQCIAEIAEALHDLHSRNIVHLDVKPANILVQFSDRYSGSVSLNSDGDIVRDVESDSVVVTFKLGDFGLACSVYDASPEDGDGAYLSWELMNQCTTPDTLPMSDIFSLGVAMYEVARAKPVRHDSAIQTSLRSGVVPPIPGVSTELMELLQSMVAKQPHDRPSAAAILAHPALEGVKCIPSHFRELSRAPSSLPSKPSYQQLEARIAALEAQLLEANRRNDALEDTLTQTIV